MAKAVVDPAEVRRFASDLKRFNTDLHSQLGQLNARFRQLGQTWRDQEHRKFAEGEQTKTHEIGQHRLRQNSRFAISPKMRKFEIHKNGETELANKCKLQGCGK